MKFEDYFYYDEASSTGLRYKIDSIKGRGKGYVSRKSGDEAGHKQFMVKRGNVPHCIRIQIKGKSFQVHRIIWILVNGEIPNGYVIDHIDGNPFNNKISNLRCIKSGHNTQNAKRRKDNSTGKTGVIVTYSRNVKYFTAIWKENKKDKTKSFSTLKYGEKQAFDLACKHRDYIIQKLNEEGELYSNRHGS